MNPKSCAFFGFLAALMPFAWLGSFPAYAADWHLGPLFDTSPLSLRTGERTEALGPFYNEAESGGWETWAVPPLFSWECDADTDSSAFDVLYPVISYDRFGSEYRYQFLQLLSLAGGSSQSGATRDRFTLFPLYFQQRSSDSSENYTALFPFRGKLKNRLFRDEIDFTLWPLYVKTKRKPGGTVSAEDFLSLGNRWAQSRRGEVTTYNYVVPFFHLRYGEGLRGWQFWPLVGHETKNVTSRTNVWGDAEISPGHEKFFALWPFWLNETRGLGTSNTAHFAALLPLYSFLRSPQRDSTSYLWPIGLTLTDDRARKYHEADVLWPVFVYARGEGKTATRVWPLFGSAHNDSLESRFYLWPLYKYSRLHSGPLDRERTRILFFVYSDIRDLNTNTAKSSHRVDCWPLFTSRRDLDGNSRLQVIAPIEPLLKGKSIERNYSPLWSLWRTEKNSRTGASSQSCLWNLYRHQVQADGSRQTSFLLGLFQHKRAAEGTSLKLFFLPVKQPPRTNTAPVVDSTGQLPQLPAGVGR